MPHWLEVRHHLKNLHKCCCFTCSFVLFFASVSLILLGVIIVKPYRHVMTFQPATCTVLSSSYLPYYKSCTCGQSCQSSFPCLRIEVEYVDPIFNNVTVGYIYENEKLAHKEGECAKEVCGSKFQRNRNAIFQYQSKYGVVGTEYACWVDPSHRNQIIKNKVYNRTQILLATILPTVGIFLAIGTLIAVYMLRRRFDPTTDPNVTRMHNPRPEEPGSLNPAFKDDYI